MNLERRPPKELQPKEKLPWSARKLSWKKSKKKDRERPNKSETQNKLKVKQFSFTAKPRSFRDKNFLSKMLVRKLLRKLESSKQTSNLLKELNRPLRRLSQESTSAGNG